MFYAADSQLYVWKINGLEYPSSGKTGTRIVCISMALKCTSLFALQGFQQEPVNIHGLLINKSTLLAKYGNSYL